MTDVSSSRTCRRWFSALALCLVASTGAACSGLLQDLGAKWVTRQIASELNLDDVQTAATRASVDRLMAAAPAALGSKVDMLVASVDVGIGRGFSDEGLLRIEKQVDKLVDVVAGAVIDEASPILATLRDDQIEFAQDRINERLEEAREYLEKPVEERVERRQDRFVESVEDWADELTRTQKQSLKAYIAGLPDDAEVRLRADEKRLSRIAALMRSHPGPQAIRDGLWKEWSDRENLGPDARSPSERRAEGRRTILYVYDLMTPEQRAHASEHLHELHDRLKSFLGTAGS